MLMRTLENGTPDECEHIDISPHANRSESCVRPHIFVRKLSIISHPYLEDPEEEC